MHNDRKPNANRFNGLVGETLKPLKRLDLMLIAQPRTKAGMLMTIYSDIKNSAMSSAARGRLSLLMLPAHSRHCFAPSSNARCTCEATSCGDWAITPEFVSTINRAL